MDAKVARLNWNLQPTLQEGGDSGLHVLYLMHFVLLMNIIAGHCGVSGYGEQASD